MEIKRGRKPGDYALYKGDDLIMVGTKEQIANYLQVKIETVAFYQSPAYRKRGKNNRFFVFRIDDEEEEDEE